MKTHKLIDNVLSQTSEKSNVNLFNDLDSVLENQKKSISTTYDSEINRIKQLMKEDDENNICSVCENKGTITIPRKNKSGVRIITCPKCNGESVHRKITNLNYSPIDENQLRNLIPNKMFRNTTFSIEQLESKIPLPNDIKEKIYIKDYIKLLDDLLNDFKNGNLPKYNYLLTAPDDFGKKLFVYQCMKECLEYNFTVSKLYDISYFNSLFNNYEFDSMETIFEKNDIIFIKITSDYAYLGLYKYLLNLSELYGIPILFISREDKKNIIDRKDNIYKPDWYDIFSDNPIEYAYSHIKQIGLYESGLKEVLNYKKDSIEEFMLNTPKSFKMTL